MITTVLASGFKLALAHEDQTADHLARRPSCVAMLKTSGLSVDYVSPFTGSCCWSAFI